MSQKSRIEEVHRVTTVEGNEYELPRDAKEAPDLFQIEVLCSPVKSNGSVYKHETEDVAKLIFERDTLAKHGVRLHRNYGAKPDPKPTETIEGLLIRIFEHLQECVQE